MKKGNKLESEVIDLEVKWAKKKDWEKYGILQNLKEAVERQRLPKANLWPVKT